MLILAKFWTESVHVRIYIYIHIYNFVWRRHENISPCTGSMVNTSTLYEQMRLIFILWINMNSSGTRVSIRRISCVFRAEKCDISLHVVNSFLDTLHYSSLIWRSPSLSLSVCLFAWWKGHSQPACLQICRILVKLGMQVDHNEFQKNIWFYQSKRLKRRKHFHFPCTVSVFIFN